jgi:hypothetical protein
MPVSKIGAVQSGSTLSGRRSRSRFGKSTGSRGALAKYSFQVRGRARPNLKTFAVSRFTIV